MRIAIQGEYPSHRVWLNGKELFPDRSQRFHNHSPDGFNWGYRGSGPTQLALAIYLEIFNNHVGHLRFRDKCIADLDQDKSFDMIVLFEIPEHFKFKLENLDDIKRRKKV